MISFFIQRDDRTQCCFCYCCRRYCCSSCYPFTTIHARKSTTTSYSSSSNKSTYDSMSCSCHETPNFVVWYYGGHLCLAVISQQSSCTAHHMHGPPQSVFLTNNDLIVLYYYCYSTRRLVTFDGLTADRIMLVGWRPDRNRTKLPHSPHQKSCFC